MSCVAKGRLETKANAEPIARSEGSGQYFYAQRGTNIDV
jgi:hypothetical protein